MSSSHFSDPSGLSSGANFGLYAAFGSIVPKEAEESSKTIRNANFSSQQTRARRGVGDESSSSNTAFFGDRKMEVIPLSGSSMQAESVARAQGKFASLSKIDANLSGYAHLTGYAPPTILKGASGEGAGKLEKESGKQRSGRDASLNLDALKNKETLDDHECGQAIEDFAIIYGLKRMRNALGIEGDDRDTMRKLQFHYIAKTDESERPSAIAHLDAQLNALSKLGRDVEHSWTQNAEENQARRERGFKFRHGN